MEILTVRQAVIDGNPNDVVRGVYALLGQGMPVQEILDQALMPGMEQVGVNFEKGDFFIPEMIKAARAMQSAMDILEPMLTGPGDGRAAAKVAIGTVENDIHEMGKNLVAMMLTGAGFEVRDLGVDVPAKRFVAAAEAGAEVIGISCLLSTTMPNVHPIIIALKQAGLRDRVKVIVGGSPINEAFARQVGADGYAPDAARAVTCVKQLLALSSN
jgi:5-methyltetrahydrofolate--homocysteine methyltransferase